jgi:stearoyl-CoA desaturase (delta-9 desaturase)
MKEVIFLRSLQVYALFMFIPAIYYLYSNDSLYLLIFSLSVYGIQQFVGFNAFMHRYVSHRTYETSKVNVIIMALLSTFTMVGSPVGWAYIHRAHHKYESGPFDPHCPVHMGLFKSFFCLWYFTEKRQRECRVSIKDVIKDPVLSFFNSFWVIINVSIQILVLCCFGFKIYAVTILIPMFLHTVVVYYFLIFYLHNFGYKLNYGVKSVSTNSTLVNILSLGEGLHNNHHTHSGKSNTKIFKTEKDPVSTFIDLIRTK